MALSLGSEVTQFFLVETVWAVTVRQTLSFQMTDEKKRLCLLWVNELPLL